MGFFHKKGTVVKKKPKNVSKYLDFANQTESQSIDTPELRQTTVGSISTTPSDIINYLDSVTIPDPPVIPSITQLVYRFSKNAHLSNLHIELYVQPNWIGRVIEYNVWIQRASTVLMKYHLSYNGDVAGNNVADKDLNFGDAIFQQGDTINIELTGGTASIGDVYEFRVKGIVTL